MVNHKLLLNQIIDHTINSFVSLLEFTAPKQIMTLIATNNCYQYAIASEANLVSKKDSFNRRNYNLDKAFETFSIDNTRFAITGIVKVIKAWWQDKAYSSKTKIIEARTTLSQVFGIFDLEVRPDWSIPENRTRRINPCMNFNPFRSACFALAAEQVLKSYGFEIFPSQGSSQNNLTLPDHKYYTSVAFYNAGLQGLDIWSDDNGFEDTQGTHWNIPELMHKQPLARTSELILDEAEHPFWEDAKAYREKQEAGFQSPNEESSNEAENSVQDIEVTREEWESNQQAREAGEAQNRAQERRQEQQQSNTVRLNPPKSKPVLKNRFTPDIENIHIPNFAWMQSSDAIAWWRSVLGNAANAWLTSHAPDWILDIVSPF